MFKRSLFVFIIVALMLAALPIQVAAKTEETARVRIGYLAFDPRTVDTYIDGEIASFSDGWMHLAWHVTPYPTYPLLRTRTATPYVTLPAGARSFAFVPKGEALEAAILGPVEVTLLADHVYSFAVMGHDGNFDVVVSNETVAFADADPGRHFMSNQWHNLKGAPPLATQFDSRLLVENNAYGEVATIITVAGVASVKITAAEDMTTVVYEVPQAIMAPGVSDFSAMIGEFPGTPGVDYFLVFAWAYPGEVTVMDAGTVAVGDKVYGEIEDTAQRVRYELTLETDATLNIYAKAAGDRKHGSWGEGAFDAALYVYDADGNLLFWNDELKHDDNFTGTLEAFDAGLEEVGLTAGSYFVEVAGSVDIIAGPYTLVVEDAASE